MTSTTLTSSSTLSQRTSMSSFELTQEVLEAARDSLLEQETQIILAENISLEGFLKVFLDYIENEQDLPVKIRLVDGKVTAYEVALTPHAVVASYIYFVADATIRPWNVPNSPPVRACNSSGYEYPTMVVEVGLIQSIRANVTETNTSNWERNRFTTLHWTEPSELYFKYSCKRPLPRCSGWCS
ncbi:uncharacterized protein OCT59_009482 [Rhizophagus irregularis]|uniref:uncharacterized protein n=1 Tax=Rhizophagus irregularis TaxID=588596 RepID=UPI003332D32A|nr:hypothetical protein OCT59_009482 [Rhizophagus irregularis]